MSALLKMITLCPNKSWLLTEPRLHPPLKQLYPSSTWYLTGNDDVLVHLGCHSMWVCIEVLCLTFEDQNFSNTPSTIHLKLRRKFALKRLFKMALIVVLEQSKKSIQYIRARLHFVYRFRHERDLLLVVFSQSVDGILCVIFFLDSDTSFS